MYYETLETLDNDEDFNIECVMNHIYDNIWRFLFCILKVMPMGSEPLKDFTYKACLRLTFAKIHSKASKRTASPPKHGFQLARGDRAASDTLPGEATQASFGRWNGCNLPISIQWLYFCENTCDIDTDNPPKQENKSF